MIVGVQTAARGAVCVFCRSHFEDTGERESSEGDSSGGTVAKAGQKVLRSDSPTFKLPAGSSVKSTAQRECHVSKECHVDDGGEALVFLLTQVSAQDWGACVPSHPRALTKSQSQRMVGHLGRSDEESQQIDHLKHRQKEASPH